MKSVLISIRPQWCEMIANGKKTIEVRKTRPKLETPFKCFIYCTRDKEHTLFKDWIDPPFVTKEYNIMNGKGIKNVFYDNRPWGNANGKVIGEFMCDGIDCVDIPYPAFQSNLDKKYITLSCCTYYMLHRYAYHDDLFFWHISDLKIYDKPRELSEFYNNCKDNVDCRKCNCFDNSFNPHDDGDRCTVNSKKPLSRPPQSWQYVEEEIE